jgi:hypothetical protein
MSFLQSVLMLAIEGHSNKTLSENNAVNYFKNCFKMANSFETYVDI